MGGAIAALIIVASLVTAFVSGIFGLAGGLMLMGLLALVLPVQAAFVTHGILQLVANGWRTVLHRRHVRPAIFGWFALATCCAGVGVSLIAWIPSKPVLFLLLGIMPVLLWLPKGWFVPDADRPSHAFASGFAAALLNLTAGVSGPLIDTVFVRTGLSRHEVVATKAAIQSLNHISKIIVYGFALGGTAQLPAVGVFVLAIPASIFGTTAGGLVLDRMNDVNFRRWTAWIVTAIGGIYLLRAISLM
jgi:uncharacterized protein